MRSYPTTHGHFYHVYLLVALPKSGRLHPKSLPSPHSRSLTTYRGKCRWYFIYVFNLRSIRMLLMRNWRQLSTQCNISDAYRGSLLISSTRSPQMTSSGVRAKLSTRRTLGTCLICQSTRVWMSLCCYWYWCLRLNNSPLSNKRLQPFWARYGHFSPHSRTTGSHRGAK